MTKRRFEPAPPDPGVRPNGIRDRAMRVVSARGPRAPETAEELKRTQEFWAGVRAGNNKESKEAAE